MWALRLLVGPEKDIRRFDASSRPSDKPQQRQRITPWRNSIRATGSRDAAWNEMQYIHQNPVRRNLITQPQDWYYSSFKDWHTNENEPIEIDKASFYVGNTHVSPTRPSPVPNEVEGTA